MEPPKRFNEVELLDRIVARWKARLLQHGPNSDLGQEAKRQIIKLTAKKELLQRARLQPLNSRALHPAKPESRAPRSA